MAQPSPLFSRMRTPAPALAFARTRERVLGIPIDVLSWKDAVDLIFTWARQRESKSVCACNVHSIVIARHNTVHANALNALT